MSNLPDLFRNSFPSRRQDPFRALARMQHEMDRIFEGFMNNDIADAATELSQRSFEPLCDVKDKDSHFLLSFAVPGFSKDDIKVEAVGNQLHIVGERRQEREEKKGKRMESSYGSIEQWLTLPQSAKAEEIEAKIENGVLEIAVPKSETSRSKQISISDGKTGFFSELLEKKDKVA